jgi:hypothetical protein
VAVGQASGFSDANSRAINQQGHKVSRRLGTAELDLRGPSCPLWFLTDLRSGFDSLLFQHALAQLQMLLAEVRVCPLSPSADEIVI